MTYYNTREPTGKNGLSPICSGRSLISWHYHHNGTTTFVIADGFLVRNLQHLYTSHTALSIKTVLKTCTEAQDLQVKHHCLPATPHQPLQPGCQNRQW